MKRKRRQLRNAQQIASSTVLPFALRQLVVGLSLLFCSSALQAQSILFDSTEHDFGVLNQGEKVSFEFSFRNVGAAPLVIHKLNPSCGCTAAVAESATIEPGSSSHIKVTFDSAGFSGVKQKTVRVYSNDPENSSRVLLVTADVRPEIYVNPSSISMADVPYGSKTTARFIIEKREGTNAKIRDVISKSKFLNVEMLNNQGSQRQVEVTVLPHAPVGKIPTRIIVRTTSQKVPVINIPVFIEVVGPFTFTPKVANFGLLRPGENKDIKVKIFSTSGTQQVPSTQEVVSSDSRVQAELLKQGKETVLKLSLQAERAGIIKGSARLKLEGLPSEVSTIQIPYFAVIE